MRRSYHTERPGHGTTFPAGAASALIQAGILLALIITPLFFNPRTQHTFEPDKAALLRSVILVAFLVWVARHVVALLSQTQTRTSAKEDLVSRLKTGLSSPLVLPAWLLLLAYVPGTVTSVLPRVSLWGSYERAQGLHTLIAYVAVFFLVRGAVSIGERRERLVDVILLVSGPVSVYAVLQHFGLDPLSFQTGGTAVTARALSTLGNPIFLGAYLVMVVPLTVLRIYQAWQSGVDDGLRVGVAGLYGGLLTVQLAAFFFAQSRGPTLGLLGALGFAVLVWAARRQARRLVLTGAVFVVLGALVLSLLPTMAPAAGLGRLTQLVDLGSRTGRQRLLVWQGVVDLVRAEPAPTLVGYGPETLRDVVGPHLPPEIASLKPDEDFDRAHNAVLDLWASTGFLGVAAYLLLVGALLYHGLRILGLVTGTSDRRHFLALTAAGTLAGGVIPWFGIGRHWIGVGLPLGLLAGVGVFIVWRGLNTDQQRRQLSGDELLTIALLAAVVGHVIETLVGIATVATYTLFWVYAALIAGLAADPEEQRSGGAEGQRSRGDFSSAPPHLRTPVPPLPCTTWGLITGVALALFIFPLLTAGQGRGFMVWGVVGSVTLLFGVLRLVAGRSDTDELIARYVGTAVGAVVVFQMLTWLPWSPLGIAHSTVSVFVYLALALPALAVTLVGTDAARTVMRRLSTERLVLYGSLAIGTVLVVWFTNVNPIRADVYYKEGLGLSTAGRLQDAVRSLETSVAVNGREDRYHSGAGGAYAQLAQTAKEESQQEAWLLKAETYLQQAQQLDPYRADHSRNLGLLYRIWAGIDPAERNAYLQRALMHYEQAAEQNPVSVRIWREWGEVHAGLKQWDAAIQRYQHSLRLNENFVETWLLLAEARLHQADYAGARQAYAEALALDRMRVLQRRQAAVEQSPRDPLPHQALALVYAALGEGQMAKTEASSARALAPDEPAHWGQFLQAIQP